MRATNDRQPTEGGVGLQRASAGGRPSAGPAAETLRLVERNVVALYTSRPILREVRQVLTDAVVRSRNLGLTDDVVDAFLRRLTFKARVVQDVPRIFAYSRDPTDEKYVDLIAAVDADYLVTRDKDLLDLRSDHGPEARQFRQRFRRVSILHPVAFLGEVHRLLPEAFKP